MSLYGNTMSRHNEKYKKKGCPIELWSLSRLDRILRLWDFYEGYDTFPSPILERINPASGTPLLIFRNGASFALYQLFMEKMGLYPELITKIWLTFVAERTLNCFQQNPDWNPEKLKMILDGLLLKIN